MCATAIEGSTSTTQTAEGEGTPTVSTAMVESQEEGGTLGQVKVTDTDTF